jgi:hypothetical protein
MNAPKRKGPGGAGGAARGRIQTCAPHSTDRGPGEQSETFRPIADAYKAGERGAIRIIDTANRFCSALFHAASGAAIPNFTADYSLPIDAMPTSTHRAALRSLIGCIECGIAPTVAQLGAVMRALGVVDADLPELLPIFECSPAGIHNWGQALIRADRRRRQIARLWRALTDRSDDPTARTYGAKPVRIVSRIRGKGARR